MAKLLCICVGLTKFEENPEGSSIFCVDLTWNDPKSFKLMSLKHVQLSFMQIREGFQLGSGSAGKCEENTSVKRMVMPEIAISPPFLLKW